MNWKTSLDRYLTASPNYDFEYWCEYVTEAMSESFFDANEDWILENNGQCEKWINRLIDKDPKQASAIIERAFNIYLR
jgi:hypothetical protein